jgi:hypothetical protein
MIIIDKSTRYLNWWRKLEDGDVVVLLERKTSSASSLAEVYISPESPYSVDFH